MLNLIKAIASLLVLIPLSCGAVGSTVPLLPAATPNPVTYISSDPTKTNASQFLERTETRIVTPGAATPCNTPATGLTETPVLGMLTDKYQWYTCQHAFSYAEIQNTIFQKELIGWTTCADGTLCTLQYTSGQPSTTTFILNNTLPYTVKYIEFHIYSGNGSSSLPCPLITIAPPLPSPPVTVNASSSSGSSYAAFILFKLR
jgi:hypothetical protein